MLQVCFTNQFKRDIKRLKKRHKDLKKLKIILDQLALNQSLNQKHRDHELFGEFSQHRECHIEPDWLLIYKKKNNIITFERTGTHADLFK